MRALPRRDRPPVEVPAGERVLAWARADDGRVLAGSRDAFYLLPPDGTGAAVRVPWEEVEAADWDRDRSTLRVTEVGTWGDRRPEHTINLPDPGRMLALVRERVTASVVLQRHVAVRGPRGLRVIARRAPRGGDAPLAWFFEYDAGIDPTDPEVHRLATDALAAARSEVDVG